MNAKQALKMADVALDGLEVIQQLTKIGGAKAAASLKAIDSLVESLLAGLDGRQSPQSVLTHIEVVTESLGGNDAAVDAKGAAKFGGTP